MKLKGTQGKGVRYSKEERLIRRLLLTLATKLICFYFAAKLFSPVSKLQEQNSDAGKTYRIQIFELIFKSTIKVKMIDKPSATITEAEAQLYDRQVL